MSGFKVQRAQVQRLRGGTSHGREGSTQTCRRGKRVVSAGAVQKERNTGDQQGSRQAIRYGSQHRVQIGLRAKSTAEFDQRLTIVISPAIEYPVHARLNAALQRVEELGRDDDGCDQSPGAEAR